MTRRGLFGWLAGGVAALCGLRLPESFARVKVRGKAVASTLTVRVAPSGEHPRIYHLQYRDGDGTWRSCGEVAEGVWEPVLVSWSSPVVGEG
jgi:hypothetical protein